MDNTIPKNKTLTYIIIGFVLIACIVGVYFLIGHFSKQPSVSIINQGLSVGNILTLEIINIPDDASYQWIRESDNITNATNNTYQISSLDSGKQIKVKVSWGDDLIVESKSVLIPDSDHIECNSIEHLNSDNTACIANNYTCHNGIPFEGQPEQHEEEKCTSCSNGYILSNSHLCIANQENNFLNNNYHFPECDLSIEHYNDAFTDCISNYHICEHGIPITDIPDEKNNQTEKCNSCDDGYHIDANSICIQNQYTCQYGNPLNEPANRHGAVGCIPDSCNYSYDYNSDSKNCIKTDCIGEWSVCNSDCISTYRITTHPTEHGKQCEYSDGETTLCNHGQDGCSNPNVVDEQENVKLAAGCSTEGARGRKCSGWCKLNNDRMECNHNNGSAHLWKVLKVKKGNGYGLKIYNKPHNKWCNWVGDNGFRIKCTESRERYATSFTLKDGDKNALVKKNIMSERPGDFALLDSGDTSCETSKNEYQNGRINIGVGPHDKKNVTKKCFGKHGQTHKWNNWVTDIQ